MGERGGIFGRFILIIALLFITFGLLLAWCVDDNDEVDSMTRAPVEWVVRGELALNS